MKNEVENSRKIMFLAEIHNESKLNALIMHIKMTVYLIQTVWYNFHLISMID